jgi:hypothetical protein
MARKFTIWLAVVLLLATTCAACGVERDRSEKPSPDWSRGLLLGKANIKQPVALQVGADKHVHLVWCDETLQYAQLDSQAKVLIKKPLAIDLPNPRKPQLLVGRQNQVHLAWLSRDGAVQKLYYAQLATDGTPTAPLLLSAPDQNTSRFQLYLSPEGVVSFIWATDLPDGSSAIVHTTLQDPTHVATLVQPGIDPYVLVDPTGTVHLAWLQQKGFTSRDLFYGTLETSTDTGLHVVPADGQKLADFEFPDGSVYDGPVIGIDQSDVYVLWSIQSTGGGLTPTSAFSYYIAFQRDNPQLANPTLIKLPPDAQPTYESYSGLHGLTRLDPLSTDDLVYSSDFINSPAAIGGQSADLPVLFSLLTRSTAQSQVQVAVAVFSDGRQVGYELASKSPSVSLMPSIATDTDSNLHIAWIDTAGFQEYDVYYASNAPGARNWLDRTSSDDLVLGAADLVWGVLSGVGLLPIAGLWTFPALVWVVLFFIFSGQEEMDRRVTRIGFGIALLIYAGMKLLLLPGLLRGTPFVNLVPPGWTVVLGAAVPLTIFALALLVVYLYTRKAQRATIFKSYLVFALVDVGLTLVLYAPRFFGGD